MIAVPTAVPGGLAIPAWFPGDLVPTAVPLPAPPAGRSVVGVRVEVEQDASPTRLQFRVVAVTADGVTSAAHAYPRPLPGRQWVAFPLPARTATVRLESEWPTFGVAVRRVEWLTVAE